MILKNRHDFTAWKLLQLWKQWLKALDCEWRREKKKMRFLKNVYEIEWC